MGSVLQRVRRGDTYAGYTNLEVITCPECGILYALPERLLEAARRKGNWEIMWHCPNGHNLGFGESEADKLRNQLEAQRNTTARVTAQRDQAQADARAQKAAKTRFRNERDRDRRRAAAGVCPCCNRTFPQLARHMAAKHPDFPPVEVER